MKSFGCMPAVRTPEASRTLTVSCPGILPSPLRDKVGAFHPDRFRGYVSVHFRSGLHPPCLRFAVAVAGHHARLGTRLLVRLCRGRHHRRLNSMRLQGATRTEPYGQLSPTVIRSATAKRSSVAQSGTLPAATRLSSPPRYTDACAPARTAPGFPARRSLPRSTPASAASAWITSTSTRSIAGTTTPRSRKRSKRCTTVPPPLSPHGPGLRAPATIAPPSITRGSVGVTAWSDRRQALPA